MTTTKLSMRQQYEQAKARHPDMLLLFRMGDFYELFDKDAETAARVLGLTLTTRDKSLAMAGFPYHQLEAYLQKLLHQGHRVAICDQVPETATFGEPVKHEPPTKKVLLGHTSAETAYAVESYPYSFRLRCKIRYWIETADKGAKKSQQRFMSQTTNPKLAGEVWNKPKGSIYHDFVVMYLDEKGHVQNDGIGCWGWPEHFTKFKTDYYDQLDDASQQKVNAMEQASRKASPVSWTEWDENHKQAEATK